MVSRKKSPKMILSLLSPTPEEEAKRSSLGLFF
jgi:hypothetical protein